MIKGNSTLELDALISSIDNIYDEIVIWDNNYTVLYANKACCRHYGLTPDDLIGKSLDYFVDKEKYWTPSSVPYVYKEKKSVIQNQKTKLGIDIVTISVPVFDEDHNVKYVVQSARDSNDFLYKMLSPLEVNQNNELNDCREIIYKSDSMKEVMSLAKKVASYNVPCMILGETGTGKSLLAKYIHTKSNRKNQPFLSINMASINPTLIESELFGYTKGSFTGANSEGKKGLFEMANGGTIFLDEIGELPVNIQAKFLHVLQESEVIPIGSVTPIKIDVRIICATNCDLLQMIDAKKFREDLYHRLNVFEINIPPLRERISDIYIIMAHFTNIYNKKYSKNCSFSDEASDLMMRYAWSGNVRELSNVIERSILTCDDDTIDASHLPQCLFKKDTNQTLLVENSLCKSIEHLKKNIIIDSYKKHKSTRKIAESLDISQSQVCRLISQYIEK